MKIGYIDGPRLRRALIAGCQWAQLQRAELNRINVFPVPDGDTGTNLYLTVQAIADHLEKALSGLLVWWRMRRPRRPSWELGGTAG